MVSTIVYFLHHGVPCQTIFPAHASRQLDLFTDALRQDETSFDVIHFDENGIVPAREEVSNV